MTKGQRTMNDYKLLPVEPTSHMLQAACDEEQRPLPMWSRMKAIYTAMLAAAPAVQGEPVAYMFADDWGRTKIVLGKETAEHWAPPGETIEPLYTAPQPEPIAPTPTFQLGDHVRKTKGSQWKGRVVGTYSTSLTPEGYAVESDTEKGSVQIYPVGALELVGDDAESDVAGLVEALEQGFPLLSDEGLDEVEHHCEWVIQRERKRVHSILAAHRKQGGDA